MKLASMILLVAALLGGCDGSPSSLKSLNESHLQGEHLVSPQFSCSVIKHYDDNYRADINVYETKMEIRQSSRRTRYVPMKYDIKRNDDLVIPDQKPNFSCSFVSSRADLYQYNIQVFEDRLVIYQASTVGRYAPLKYAITPIDALNLSH